jgi:hypothetical protein
MALKLVNVTKLCLLCTGMLHALWPFCHAMARLVFVGAFGVKSARLPTAHSGCGYLHIAKLHIAKLSQTSVKSSGLRCTCMCTGRDVAVRICSTV